MSLPDEDGGGPVERSFSARPTLLERDAELGAVDALIGAAARGGRLLVIEGPPGIGKTSLIVEAKARAQEAGLQVLSARGSDLERAFSYGVVRQLFEPLLARLSDEERAALLGAGAELAAPLFDPVHLADQPSEDISLAMLHGLFWLTADIAVRGPILLAVDDLQWCDAASVRWLGYLLPRMEGLPVLLVVSLRPAEPGEDPALIGRILSDPLAVVIRPPPLSVKASAQFVRASLPPGADDAFCFACHEETGGNPLLLRELANGVADEGLAPIAANVPRLRELEARVGGRAVSVRLSRLPPEATRFAHAVAILGDGADPHLAAALADLDEDRASQATADLVRADVLLPRSPLGFVHPLIRAAVYEGQTPLERSRGHALAWRLLAEAGAEPERIGAHLLRVPGAGDARIVSVLRDAARRAGSRGASESAVAYLRRALAEPPPAEERAQVLLELGSAEALVSGRAAVEHLREVHDLVSDPILRAKAALMLGRQLFFLQPDESAAVFTRALEELAGVHSEPAGVDSELERVLEAGLITNALFGPSLYPEAVRRLERVRADPRDVTVAEKMLLALLAFHDARANVPAAVAVALARRARFDEALPAGEISSGPLMLASAVLAIADLDDALPMCDAAIADAHRRGSVIAFATAKAHRAEALVYRGDLAEAEAEGREALAAFDSWQIAGAFPALLGSFLAEALMEQGRLDEAASVLARGGFGESPPETLRLYAFLFSRAHFHIMSGNTTGGLEEMLEAGRRFQAVGGRNPAFMPWRSQAALVLLPLGRQAEARRLADEELELAHIWGAPRALGAALRAVGLVQGGAEGLARLEEAVGVLAGSPAKLEHAKARTELGAALRRANRRAQAREHLRRAVELATICGAAPLAARAEAELLATGARPRRIALSGVESLTPSERRVAEMAAAGPSNREIAQALFVTPKTVEVHLSSAYRKLGISSRSQLAAALAEPARV